MGEILTSDIIIEQMQPFLMVVLAGFSIATILILITYGISKCLALFNIVQ